jgi:Xaa-Pro aminopeptidase
MNRTSNMLETYWNERRRRFQSSIADAPVDGVILVDRALLSWLGFARETQLLLVTADAVNIVEVGKLSNYLGTSNTLTLGFDPTLSAAQLVGFQEAMPKLRWKCIGSSLDRLRMVKDELEVALLKKAAQITSCAFERLAPLIEEGRSELDLLSSAYETMLEAGGNGYSFDPSIAGGARTSQLWAGVTLRRFQLGEPVLIDLGIGYRGYQCDMSRTYLVGGRSAATLELWTTALSAVEEILALIREQIRPGMRCDELHISCTRMLERAGFSNRMQHALGHGVGLRVHEPPYLAPGSLDILTPGMVLAIEPGIVFENTAGFRREDVVLITDSGCETLTDGLDEENLPQGTEKQDD